MRGRKGSRANPRTPDFTRILAYDAALGCREMDVARGQPWHSDLGQPEMFIRLVSRRQRASKATAELTWTRDHFPEGRALLKAPPSRSDEPSLATATASTHFPRHVAAPAHAVCEESRFRSSARSLEQPAGEIRGPRSLRAVGRDGRREMINLEIPPMDAIMPASPAARARVDSGR